MYYTISKAIKSLGFFLGIVVISLSLSYLTLAWTEPSVNPPNNNVSTPLNIGSTGQSKSGGLILNTGGAANGLIVQSGNVGIGTPSPGAKLDVNGNIQIANGQNLIFNSASDSGIQLGFGTNIYRIASDGHLKLSSQNSNIELNGNVGIGTAGPRTKLDVWGGIIYATGADFNGTATMSASAGNAYFGNNGIQNIVVNPSGNVGIGTTNVTRGVDMRQRVLIRDPAYSGANGWDTADWGGALEIKRPGASSMAAANLWNSQLAISSQGSVSPDTAHISFHRPGIYGANFGLDTDNWFSTQG